MKRTLLIAVAMVLLLSNLSAQIINYTADVVWPYPTHSPDPCNGQIEIFPDDSNWVDFVWSDGQHGSAAYDLCADLYCVTMTDSALCFQGFPCTQSVCWDFRIPCVTTYASSINSNFNNTNIMVGRYIWFNSVIKVNGVGSQPVTIHFTGQTIKIGNGTPFGVPDADITINPSGTATTTYTAGKWTTEVPKTGGNYFLSGVAYPVPPAGIPGGSQVVWDGKFSASQSGITVEWKWGAAVYAPFTGSMSSLGVKPLDDNHASVYQNGDNAGTPENYKANVIAGAKGNGGNNYTGSYSGKANATINNTTVVDINTTSTAATCPGSATGSITITGGRGVPPYTFSIDGINFQTGGTFSGLTPGSYTAVVQDANGCTASHKVTVANPPGQLCDLGYPDNSNLPRSAAIFNESEILVAYDPSYNTTCSGTAQTIKMWYSDEHAMVLGVRQVNIKTASGITTTNYPITPATTTGPSSAMHPAVGSTIPAGDQSGNDIAVGGGRPLWPALFITDITNSPGSRIGDWQQGGTGIPPHAIYGTWKGAVKLVDKTKNPQVVTVTPDADPEKNHWNLAGGDAPPAGIDNEGYLTEVVWNVNELGLTQGHTYHLQFMVHDGDQNKTGGDVGQGCTTITIPVPRSEISTTPENTLHVAVNPNPFKNSLQVNVQTNADEPINLKMYNLLGSLVAERQNIAARYDLQLEEQLSPGVYLIEVKQGNLKQVIRMVKE